MSDPIENLRRQAKRLRKSWENSAPEAIARLEAVLPPAKRGNPQHAEFLHVIARERNFTSWPALKAAAETDGLDKAEKQQRLKIALFHGQNHVVRALLDQTPDLARGILGLEIALYDLPAVEAAITNDPACATRKLGPRTPILHLCFSRYIHIAPKKKRDMLRIAALLVAHGANVNDGFEQEPGSGYLLPALYGALGHANNLALAEWLLDHGANPNDEESLYHSTELGHHDGLRLLLKHGATTKGTNALIRMLDFDDLKGARILLEHGADPNEVAHEHPSGEPIPIIPSLHQAARRGRDGRFADLLLEFGADATFEWQGYTPWAVARIYGNASFADALAACGYDSDLSAEDQVLADCAALVKTAERVKFSSLPKETRLLLTRIASMPGRVDHAKALIAAGFDPDYPDEMGLPPLHLAGWAGRSDMLRYLLTLGPDLSHKNGYGGNALETVVHGSENAPRDAETDHAECIRLLIGAGAEPTPLLIENAGDPEISELLRQLASETA